MLDIMIKLSVLVWAYGFLYLLLKVQDKPYGIIMFSIVFIIMILSKEIIMMRFL